MGNHVHVGLLRGINVGKAKRISMADLRAVVESLGYRDVRTLLNSGNVLFSSSEPCAADSAAKIGESLKSTLSVMARVTVLTADDLSLIVNENSLGETATDPSRLLVAVLNDPADRSTLEPLLDRNWSPDILSVGSRAAYLWCSGGILESELAKAVGRALRDRVTTRNWSTILKLHAMAGDSD